MMTCSIACRGCGAPLCAPFLDLGPTPLANSYLAPDDLVRAEPFYPLGVYICAKCFLMQVPPVQSPEAIFGDYAYFSSYSTTWLAHAEAYARRMVDDLSLDSRSLVIEIASNDGYLLRPFQQRGIPVLGVEPARNVARVAQARGIPTLVDFFGARLADDLSRTGRQADLLVGNNVLAHVPDLDDFVDGLRRVLKPGGLITLEFPHVLRLIEENQFDTIYHEHLSYLSLAVVSTLFQRHGLTVVDVEELPTHGGSLRVHGRHRDDPTAPPTGRVAGLIAAEEAAGLTTLEYYQRFARRVHETKRALLELLITTKRSGATVVAYGAAAKGNTLLNYCGVRTDFVEYAVDRNPHKQGRYLPGTRIPIFAPERISETRPEFVLILPWNLRTEITRQLSEIRAWGGRFVVPIPRVETF